ncbi:hypothetical protein FOMPIDRAFT_1116699, partial [Fomitopsis schrenkii]
TRPTSTTAKDAHLASRDILALLEDNGVYGAVVEWFEGTVEKLTGPPLLPITDDITDDMDPSHSLRQFLTAGLGMPIATAEREAEDAHGSVAFFFHEQLPCPPQGHHRPVQVRGFRCTSPARPSCRITPLSAWP